MLSQSVITQLNLNRYNQQREDAFYHALWSSLSVTEKLQAISEAPSKQLFAIATRDNSEIVRYWAIRHAGQDRNLVTHSDMRRLHNDTSELVANRAAIWSYEDVVQGELAAVEAFISGATWLELCRLPAIIKILVEQTTPDWPRIHAILRTFFCAPEVEKALHGPEPHNEWLIDDAVSALEYLKSLMLQYPDILHSTLGILLPLGFHHFSLLHGWQNFPADLLAAIVWSNKGSYIDKTILEPLGQRDLRDPKLVALRDHLQKADSDTEFISNSWAAELAR